MKTHAMVQQMLKNNATARYRNACARQNFEGYLDEYWMKGICECCEEPEASNPKPRRCEYSDSCRVHDYCSFLCDNCATIKSAEAEEEKCAYCYIENTRRYSKLTLRESPAS